MMQVPALRVSRSRQVIVIPAAILSLALLAASALTVSAQERAPGASTAGGFSLEQVMSYPFPADLVASPAGDRIAWTFVTKGVRSLWVADGPDYAARALVTYTPDDGQELSGLAFSGDGRHVVYVRGGDHGSNWPADKNLMPNPTSSPVQPKEQIWAVAVDAAGTGGSTAGSKPVLIADGDAPAPAPGTGAGSDRVAFERDEAIWIAPIDGSKPAARLFFARGRNESPTWSPDGRTLAFVSTRGSQSYIGLYTTDDQPVRYLAPSVSLDDTPRWSPDGTRIAFVRRPGRGGPSASPLDPRPQPWAIWVADVNTGDAREVWRSPTSGPSARMGSIPRTQGGPNLAWGADDRLVFLSYQDGWPHLYSVSAKASASATAAGAQALLLTPGPFMVEFVSMTPDRRFAIYNANTGDTSPSSDDIDRRHLFKVPVNAATPTPLTRGAGIEWAPVVTANGRTVAYFASTAQRPGLPTVRPLEAPADTASAARTLAADQIANDFPTAQLVTPEHVTYKAPDGTTVHGQLFRPSTAGGGAAAEARRPAIVFVHGGPPRQMLLGWHYRYYYANSYALNQYLASRGFLVLSVNFRLGIGYGYDFHNPRDGGARGASEYQDVLAGGRDLQSRTDVDPKRIGIWGGSYGGFLTALALARNSDVFAAGVDIHGVHIWANQGAADPTIDAAATVGDGLTRAQLDEAARVAWSSSPASHVSTWKSPVLLIHGDDDRNVRANQTVDLARRLEGAGVTFEEIIIPDDIHDFLLYRNWLRVNRATAEFLERYLKPGPAKPVTSGPVKSNNNDSGTGSRPGGSRPQQP